jgi:putative phosphonate metabolism protein
MASFPRYAIYYAAPFGSALDRFGAEHLGYDAWRGEDLPFPDKVLKMVPDWHALTLDPRKYGFHATLKAPMALAQGTTEAELVEACADFVRAARPLPVIRAVVGSISGFAAVIPAQTSSELIKLAEDCVRRFDGFRAPLTPHERARRKPDMLTPRQRDYLERWGYPYVMDDFRFHMTLTGRLDAARREPVVKMLQHCFKRTGIEQLVVDRIALFRQSDRYARFQIIGDWPLRAVS